MKVSVVIPTYNRAQLIARAVESVQAQTYEDWECIVVDDCSTDDTSRVVQEMEALDRRVKYVRMDVNGGANAARNRGTQGARGEWVAFLDSDDEWLPNFLRLQLQTAERNPGVALVYCWATFYHDTYVYDRCGRYSGHDLHRSTLGGYFTPSTSQIMACRETLLEVGGFDEQMPTHQEREMIIRLTEMYDAQFTPAILVHGHRSDRWEHVTKVGPTMCQAIGRIYAKHGPLLEREGLTERMLRSAIRGMIFNKPNDPPGARRFSRVLRQRNPLNKWGYICPLLSYLPDGVRRQVPGALRSFRAAMGKESNHTIWSLRERAMEEGI